MENLRLICFNPLPSPKQGETVRCRTELNRTCFNPLPSPKQGETSIGAVRTAPLTEATPNWVPSFNPLPSPKQGETGRPRDSPPNFYEFQSAPLTEARGDRSRASQNPPRFSFNPLPSPKQGETQPIRRQAQRRTGFNPLPSPKQGETRVIQPRSSFWYVSIRSPHRSKGRPSHYGREIAARMIIVSIRSPHRSKGRPGTTKAKRRPDQAS